MSARSNSLLKNLRLSTTDGITAALICHLILPGNFIVAGAMRNIRALSAMLGLGFFVNHIFYRQTKK